VLIIVARWYYGSRRTWRMSIHTTCLYRMAVIFYSEVELARVLELRLRERRRKIDWRDYKQCFDMSV